MKRFYNIVLVLLHTLGLLFISNISFSRAWFYINWRPMEELFAWSCIIIVFILHYALVFLGNKKKLLSYGFLNALRIIEYILAGIQILFLGVMYILCGFNLTFAQTYPMVVIHIMAVIFRMICMKKLEYL